MGAPESRFDWSVPVADAERVELTIDGVRVRVPAGTTVAAAMLGHDDQAFCESAATAQRRGPYCLMGICFECTVTIDGVGGRQACLEPVRAGMSVTRGLTPADGLDAT